MDKITTPNQPATLQQNQLWSYYHTTKKTIKEYVRELDRHNAFRSLAPQFRNEVCVDDRGKLVDLYDACYDQDAHLMSTMETLYSKILGKRYALGTVDEKGKFHKDIEQTKKIRGTVFVDLNKEIVKAKAYGYTAIEILPDINPTTGKLCHIKSIERRNILPLQRRIVQRQGEYSPGWNFDDDTMKPYYFLIEDRTHPLGFYSATTPIVLAKKFTHANHVGFSHTYGQPIIHGKTPSDIQGDRDRLANNIASAATNKVIVTGMEDEIDIKNFASTNSEKIFTSIKEEADRDISNLILGSESMAGAAQSYVGAATADENILRERVGVYREFVENIWNEEIIPRLVAFGYIPAGLVFQYQEKIDMSAKDLIRLVEVLSGKFKMDPEVIEDIIGVPVGEQLEIVTSTALTDDGEEGEPGGRRMSDDEYLKRYGHPRNRVNFITGKK